MSEFECKRCGKCCIHLALQVADEEDLERWKDHPKIMKYVSSFADLGMNVADIWINQRTGEELDDCPFYRSAKRGGPKCSIYELRPNICREYPDGKECLREKDKK